MERYSSRLSRVSTETPTTVRGQIPKSANKLALMGLVPGWRTVYSYNTRLPPLTPPPILSRLSPGAPGLRRERIGGGVGRGTRFIAGNVRHPGTRPGQPAIEGMTLNTYQASLAMEVKSLLRSSRKLVSAKLARNKEAKVGI